MRDNALEVIMSVLIITATQSTIAASSGVFNIRDYGAIGDGKALDTSAIQKAIDACSDEGGGQVLFPPGRYLSGTIYFKSHVTLFLEAGATLVGTTSLNKYQQPIIPAFMPEAGWGKWHRALILGNGLKDITICGQGVIDGNKVFDPTGEERMRGPHTFVFVNCHNVRVNDISFLDSANYAIFFQISDDVEIRNVKFTGGWDGIHFRGAPLRPCRNVSIVGCQFFTGDDSIAGRYWENTLISDCIINSSCNGIRLIGPASGLIIHDCLFYGPGIRPHRTSNRYNMLAGLNLQPGAWDATKGSLDNVLISDITMHNVSTPFHFSLKPGNTAENITVNRVSATGVYRAASSVESWTKTAFKKVTFRDITIEYKGGGTRKQALTKVKSPGVDARPLPAWGFYAHNVENLTFDNIRLHCEKEDLRPVLMCEGVERLTLEDFKFPSPAEISEAFALDDVMHIRLRDMKFITVEPRCIELNLITEDNTSRLTAGKTYTAKVTVENGKQKGLAKIRLITAGQKKTKWLWLQAGQKKEVVFKDLTAHKAGILEVQCGNITKSLHVE
jgi:polygalacturonase